MKKPENLDDEDQESSYSLIYAWIFKKKQREIKEQDDLEERYNPFIEEFNKKMKFDEDENMSDKETDISAKSKIKSSSIFLKTHKSKKREFKLFNDSDIFGNQKLLE